MISVIVPAHNEEVMLARNLPGLVQGPGSEDLEVIVVCNGCSDRSADVARQFPVEVVELEESSKTTALNHGDQIARFFPRFYVDADIGVTAADLMTTSQALSDEVCAVSPEMRPVLVGRPWTVKAFYRVWQDLSYCQSLVGSGVFGLDARARGYFDEFPSVIADDLFARLHVRPHERSVVHTASFALETPHDVRSLIRVKTRAHLGLLQLRDRQPELFVNEDADHPRALLEMAGKPSRWPEVALYLVVRMISRTRATIQHRRGQFGRWERDETTRQGVSS